MKQTLHLINFELKRMLGILLILSGILAGTQIIALLIQLFNPVQQYLRFEDMMQAAGYPAIFFAVLAAFLLITALQFYQHYLGSKSIYTLLSMPTDRRLVLFSKWAAGYLGALTLAAVQLLWIFVSYGFYRYALPEIPRMNNGLFLAFMRSSFLRLLLPFSFYPFLISLFCLAVLALLSLYCVLCERSGSRFRLASLSALILGALIYLFPLYNRTTVNIIAALVLIAAAAAYMILYSVRAIQHAKIV